MNRMRAGLTGLGIVFLSTLAVSLLFGPSPDLPPSEQTKAAGEPLAQLGVAPGMEKDKEARSEDLPGEPQSPADPRLADPRLADPRLADPLLTQPLPGPVASGAPLPPADAPVGQSMGGTGGALHYPDGRPSSPKSVAI